MKTKQKKTALAVAAIIVAVVNIVVLSIALLGREDTYTEPLVSDTDAAVQTGQENEQSNETEQSEPAKSAYADCQIGDIIEFGTLEQDADESTVDEPIEWVVIDRNENAIFVVSRYGLMPVQFHWNNTRYPKHITWEESNIRYWLNNDFYTQCFTPEEREQIALTYVENSDSSKYSTKGGNDTCDYIFFLSHSEVEKYFPSVSDKLLEPTPAAVEAGAYVKNNQCFWWLRTPGKYQCNAEYVFTGGSIYAYGSDVGHDNVCARPAMWINI